MSFTECDLKHSFFFVISPTPALSPCIAVYQPQGSSHKYMVSDTIVHETGEDKEMPLGRFQVLICHTKLSAKEIVHNTQKTSVTPP